MGSRLDDDLAEDLTGTKPGEGFGNVREPNDLVDDRLELSESCPIECDSQVDAVATVAANQALLLHEQWPKIQTDVPAGCGAASNNRSPTCQAGEYLLQNFSTDVLHDEINTPLACEFPDLGRPVGIRGIENRLCTEAFAQLAFFRSRASTDDASALSFGDLDRRGADTARGPHHEHPIPGPHLGASSEHVHGSTACER